MRKAPFMPRLLAATIVAMALVAVTTGCRMGGNPLDYCGPVYCGGTIPPCAQDVRAGSILSPPTGPVMQPVPVEGETVSQTESSPEPTPAPKPRAQVRRRRSHRVHGSRRRRRHRSRPFEEEPTQSEALKPASSDGWVPRGHG